MNVRNASDILSRKTALFRVEITTVILLQQYLFKRVIVMVLPVNETQEKMLFKFFTS